MKPCTTIRLTAAAALLAAALLAASCDPSSAFQPTAFTGRHPSSPLNPAITSAPPGRNRITQRHAVMVEDPTMVTSGLDAFFQSQPYLAAFLTCSVKAGTADLLAQKQVLSGGAPSAAKNSAPGPNDARANQEDETPFDLPRNLSFVFYGGLVQGMFQQFLFSVIYPVMFGHDHTFFTTLQQVAFDVGVMPFVYLPLVYSIKSLFSASNAHGFSLETVQDGLAKLWDDIMNKGLLKTYWSIWIPAQSLTFSVVPPHLRVLFVALVSFCWVTILSSISSSTSATSTPVPAAARDDEKNHSTSRAGSSSSRQRPSLQLPPSVEGLLEAFQRSADALHDESNRAASSPQGPAARRPAYVAVSAASAPADRPPVDGTRDYRQ